MGTGTGRLNKSEFSELLGVVWTQAMKPENIISGFKTTGPVDSSKFPIKEFSTEDLNAYNENLNKNGDPNYQNQESRNPIVTNITFSIEAQDLDTPSTSGIEAHKTSSISLELSEQVSNQFLEPCQLNCESSNPLVSKPKATSDIEVQSTSSTPLDLALPELNEVERLFFEKPEPDAPKNESVKPTSSIRLKQRAYGEVLTTEEVLIRLKEAEEKKQLKGKKIKRTDEQPKAGTSSKRQKLTKKVKIGKKDDSSSDEGEAVLDDASNSSFEEEIHEDDIDNTK